MFSIHLSILWLILSLFSFMTTHASSFCFQIATHLNLFTDCYGNALDEGATKVTEVLQLWGELEGKTKELADHAVKISKLEKVREKMKACFSRSGMS